MCINRTRINKLLKYIRHNNHRRRTNYDKRMSWAFKQSSPFPVLDLVSHICIVMRKVGKKLMRKYNIECSSDYCCLEKLIEEYRYRKLEAVLSKRWRRK